MPRAVPIPNLAVWEEASRGPVATVVLGGRLELVAGPVNAPYLIFRFKLRVAVAIAGRKTSFVRAMAAIGGPGPTPRVRARACVRWERPKVSLVAMGEPSLRRAMTPVLGGHLGPVRDKLAEQVVAPSALLAKSRMSVWTSVALGAS